MTAGGARRGRRDNGLDAADYAVAGDVDPRVGEHLLDVLAIDGIAAYLQPSADLNPILRATTLPARPTDRLYVDRTRLDAAREHFNKITGGKPPTPPPDKDPTREPDIEAEFAKIVAGFHTDVDPTAEPWPATENIETKPEPPMSAGPKAPDAVTYQRRVTDQPSLLDGLDTFGADLDDQDDEEEERYVPPPPPPLPRISKYAVIGILAVVAGFVLFLFPRLIPIDQDYVTLIGFAAIVTGAVMLVWRLRSGDDDEDDFDDGAVV
ncbi:DUF308 domain-containing protein [Actinoplanes sp. TBRC 11911]|uniref:DUF308 domain-containing protein n=1 Tax=Actinoplanes sp. TBRC 11911 TaxID=2729386 RepID=UPI00145D5D32|nr:DUF308 domain-containing protein [Actinoplanes sp. TBRC 11911]NMO53108.1 DUF308 domain-containing protein [Actinoplanes sp. TBRC 11911]